jgi:hypothetical protein
VPVQAPSTPTRGWNDASGIVRQVSVAGCRARRYGSVPPQQVPPHTIASCPVHAAMLLGGSFRLHRAIGCQVLVAGV